MPTAAQCAETEEEAVAIYEEDLAMCRRIGEVAHDLPDHSGLVVPDRRQRPVLERAADHHGRHPEASGIAASRLHPDLLYVLDDGPGTTSVLAISARDARVIVQIQRAQLTAGESEVLEKQPPWSDCPVIVTTLGGRPANIATMRSVERFRNVTFLEQLLRLYDAPVRTPGLRWGV